MIISKIQKNFIIILMSNNLLHSSQGLRDNSLHKSDSKLHIAGNSPIETTEDQ